MRAQDAGVASESGARYLGVVLAPGKRQLQPTRARDVLAGDTRRRCQRVGVFATTDPTLLLATARAAELDVLQLLQRPEHDAWDSLRATFAGEIWGVVRIGQEVSMESAWASWELADAIVLDAYAGTGLGGTGTTFDWESTARLLAPMRAGRRIVVAGGLDPHNVRDAIDALQPDIVDVSSGVEQALGEKSATRIAAFVRAAAGRAT